MGVFGNKSNTSQSVATPVTQQLAVLTGSLGSTVLPQTTQLIPNYKGLPLSSLQLSVAVTDTTAGTVGTGDTSSVTETTISQFQIISANGKILVDLDGTRQDISLMARLLTAGGKYTPSGKNLNNYTTISTANTNTWNVLLPFSIAPSDFPLKLNVKFNTLASRLTAGTALASSSVTLTVFGNYVAHPFRRSILRVVNIPVSATGTATLNTYYDYGKVVQTQAYQYGADANIGTTGITFSANGDLQSANITLQNFITKENTIYANSVPVANQDANSDTGHIAGFVNLFSDAFVATPATQFTINFATAPSTIISSLSNTLVAYWIEDY